jgi:2,4-didehydro-3-deoxy-L-rhamnonate hydrolase
MKLVGYRTAEGAAIGRLYGESKLVPLGSLEQFWTDPAQGILRSSDNVLDVGELSLVPPVPPAARVLCVGLN